MSLGRMLRKAVGAPQEERRKSPRVRCRLNCVVRKGRKRFPARVLDVSEGGLCLLSPVALPQHQTVQIQIDVPPRGPVEVEAVAWHLRRVRNSGSAKKTWSIGMTLTKAADGFRALLPAQAAAPTGVFAVPDDQNLDLGAMEISEEWEESSAEWERLFEETEALLESSDENSEDCELQLYRVRVKAITGPRTRTLTLSASSAAEAEDLARVDLDDSWQILEVSEA